VKGVRAAKNAASEFTKYPIQEEAIMNRSARIALVFGGLMFGLTAPAIAQTATANLSVTASVQNKCTITTSAVSFGTYDPVVDNATTPLDAQGAVILACTKGAAGTRIDLGQGAHFSGARRMQAGTEFLTYELYSDSGRATVWGAGSGSGVSPTAAPSIAARSFPVYGRVAGGQDVAVGSYTDTVVATINF
jgi:spore coat protein U domain-containing protein, fimbrial subunit CupE1/2/3/6